MSGETENITHSIFCPALVSDALQKRGNVPGECICGGKPLPFVAAPIRDTMQTVTLPVATFQAMREALEFYGAPQSYVRALCEPLKPIWDDTDDEVTLAEGEPAPGAKARAALSLLAEKERGA